jgi:DNA-binding transcriptional LysR family regulator
MLMKRSSRLDDLLAFVTVARERSFTKAAAKLGVSQSALSHTVRLLENRLGFRLLTRTTRSVSATDSGERLLRGVGPHFDAIEEEFTAIRGLRDKPAGSIRITTSAYAAEAILWPVLEKFLPRYPEIKVELSIDSALTDIAAQRFDAGVRLGEQVAPGMIAARIGPDTSMAVIGAPAYFKKRSVPQVPQDLTAHDCINLRLQTHGGLYAWEFEKDDRKLNVRVDGQLTFNAVAQVVAAALAGFGLACVPAEIVSAEIRKGRLQRVLTDWCPSFPGFHLYYPSRRYASPAFALLVDALRYRAK